MLNSFFVFLLESSICLLLFAVFYKIVFQKETFFSWNRFYLLASLILSVLIPLVNIPILEIENPLTVNITLLQSVGVLENKVFQNNSNVFFTKQTSFKMLHVFFYFLAALYFLIASFMMVKFIKKLVNIKFLISSNTKTKEQHYWIVSIQNPIPTSSFFRYIFINKNLKKIDNCKFEIIKRHESIHANQMHSLDNIISEILLILFWFNPIMYFYKKSIQETHEFIVDETLTRESADKREYADLLLNLAIQNVNISPFLGFSVIKVNKRINMLNKQKSKTMKKVSFLLIIPLMATMLLSFSISDKNTETHFIEHQSTNIDKSTIGKIIWEGNSAYSDTELSKALRLHSGDEYNFDVDKRLNGNNSKILNMYMDNGYVFYRATHKQSINNKIADITITIEEHTRGVIGKIAIKGNSKVSDQKIFNKLKIKQGDIFNRSAIHRSTDAIDKMKNIKFKNIHVLPEQGVSSKEGFAIIDLEFIVAEE